MVVNEDATTGLEGEGQYNGDGNGIGLFYYYFRRCAVKSVEQYK